MTGTTIASSATAAPRWPRRSAVACTSVGVVARRLRTEVGRRLFMEQTLGGPLAKVTPPIGRGSRQLVRRRSVTHVAGPHHTGQRTRTGVGRARYGGPVPGRGSGTASGRQPGRDRIGRR